MMSEAYPIDEDVDLLESIRQAVPISTVVGEKIEIIKAGREWKARCPFHNEKTPSFYINDDKAFYHCFGCGAHGDVIRFVAEQEGLPFREAVKVLAARAGLPIRGLEEATLRKMAELICGDDGPVYRRSSDLTRFFSVAGAPRFEHDGSTRVAWVLNALKEARPSELKSILLRLVSPREYDGDAEKVRFVLGALTPLLKLDGVSITFDGPTPVVGYTEPTFDLAESQPRVVNSETTKASRVFISYAHADEALKNQFINHLTALRHEGLVSMWHDRKLLPGQQLDSEIEAELAASDLVVMLVSADFLASDYCIEKEMRRAFERQRSGEVAVAAIVLRDCQWQYVPVGEGRVLRDFLALPRDGKPVTKWGDIDEPLSMSVGEIRRVLLERSPA